MKSVEPEEEVAMNEFGLKDGANCPEMWAGGSWQQWPLQPSMFQNIPHEQIDWAALAQQWIQMRETMGGSSNDQPQPPMIGGNVHVPPRSVDAKPMKQESAIESPDEDASSFRQGEWNYWSNSNWNANNPPPPPPPPAQSWNASLHANEAKESLSPYEFGQAHGNQGFPAQSYDYNHGSDQYGYKQVYVEQNQFNQYWPGGQSGAIFPRKEHRMISEREGIPPVREDEEMMAMPPSLDAAKRKQLPAWIREGLEKMEREKQKRLEKERLLKEREEQLRSMKEAEERALKEFMEERGGDSLIPRKSKFDSDSEEEEEVPRRSPSPVKRHYSSGEEQDDREEDDEARSDEEKLADLMMRVRQLLTEILLEVTNEEVIQIAKEVVNRAKAKAPAMQLASSSALASITRGLGLGDYGSDSEESGGEEDDADDSDLDLRASIDQRKREFAEKEKEIIPGFRIEESDQEPEPDDERKQNDFLQPSPEREKYHFETKYNEIPGLDVKSTPDEISNPPPEKTNLQEILRTLGKDSSESKPDPDRDSSSRKSASSESDSERDSRTSSSSRGRDRQNEKSQRRDRNSNSSRDNRDRRVDRRRRSRSRDRRRSRSNSTNRRPRNTSDRRSSYGSRSGRKERSRRSRSQSPSRRQRRDRGRRNSRSYSRSRSRSPRKHSSRRGRENSRRESRSPSGEGSGKKSSRKPTT